MHRVNDDDADADEDTDVEWWWFWDKKYFLWMKTNNGKCGINKRLVIKEEINVMKMKLNGFKRFVSGEWKCFK